MKWAITQNFGRSDRLADSRLPPINRLQIRRQIVCARWGQRFKCNAFGRCTPVLEPSNPSDARERQDAALPVATQNRWGRVRSPGRFAFAKIAGRGCRPRDAFSPLALRVTIIPCMHLRQHCGDRQSHVSNVCQSKTKASGGALPAAPSGRRRGRRADPVRAGSAGAKKCEGRRGDAGWSPLIGRGMAKSIGAMEPNVGCHPVIFETETCTPASSRRMRSSIDGFRPQVPRGRHARASHHREHTTGPIVPRPSLRPPAHQSSSFLIDGEGRDLPRR